MENIFGLSFDSILFRINFILNKVELVSKISRSYKNMLSMCNKKLTSRNQNLCLSTILLIKILIFSSEFEEIK